MRDLIILPSWLVVNPSPEPEVTESFWDPWFGDEERSDEERSDEVTFGGSN